jgi:hypothetical protein
VLVDVLVGVRFDMVFGRAEGGIDVTSYLIEWCLSRDRSPSQTITIKSSLTKRGGNPNSRFRHFECMSVRGLQTPSFGSPQDRPPVSDDVTNQITGVLHSTESGRGGQSHVLCYFVWCRKVKAPKQIKSMVFRIGRGGRPPPTHQRALPQ